MNYRIHGTFGEHLIWRFDVERRLVNMYCKLVKHVAVMLNMESYESEQVVCAHHVYKSVWTLFIGEEFPWVQVAPVASCHLHPCSPS